MSYRTRLAVVAAALTSAALSLAPSLAADETKPIPPELFELRQELSGGEPGGSLRASDEELAREIELLQHREPKPQARQRRTEYHDRARRSDRPADHRANPRNGPRGDRRNDPHRRMDPHNDRSPDGLPDRRRLLRETAFRLDTLAHQLEVCELCDQADELRRVAARLRSNARRQPGGPRPTHDAGPQPAASQRLAPPQPALPPEIDLPGGSPMHFPGPHERPRPAGSGRRPAPERLGD